MARSIRRTAQLAGLALAASSAALAPAVAMPATGEVPVATSTHETPQVHGKSAKPKTVQVKGALTLIDLQTGKYKMSGDLVGEWTMVPSETLHKSATLYVESGREKFIGCVDLNHNARCGKREPTGEMRSSYLYWASFDAKGKLIKGQCVHPITGGNKSFKGARGLLNMFDRPKGKEVLMTYKGEIILNAVRSDAPLPPLNSTASTAAPRTLATTC